MENIVVEQQNNETVEIEGQYQGSKSLRIQGRFWDSDHGEEESMTESEEIIKERALQGRRKYSKEVEDIKQMEQEGKYSFRRVKGKRKDKTSQ